MTKRDLFLILIAFIYYLWLNLSILTATRVGEAIIFSIGLLIFDKHWRNKFNGDNILYYFKVVLIFSLGGFLLFKYLGIGWDYGLILSRVGDYELHNHLLFLYRIDPFNGTLRFHFLFLEPNHFALFSVYFFYLFLFNKDWFGVILVLIAIIETLSLFGLIVCGILLFIRILPHRLSIRRFSYFVFAMLILGVMLYLNWSYLYDKFIFRIVDYDLLTEGLKYSNRFEGELYKRYNTLGFMDLLNGRGFNEYYSSITGYNSGYLEFMYVHGYIGLFFGIVLYALILGRINLSVLLILTSLFLSNGYINWYSIVLLTLLSSLYVEGKANMLGFK